MKLFKTSQGFYAEVGNNGYLVDHDHGWDDLINRDNLFDFVSQTIAETSPEKLLLQDLKIEKPVGSQEIWAAGVTYHSSQLARMHESRVSGGGNFYSMVYMAERPEIFFKATSGRIVGPNQGFRIRKDSSWDVPEPELTLFASSSGKIVAYTIGNDVSSRSIEGENPLYLPQAKTYDGCACLGPCLYLTNEDFPSNAIIKMDVTRSEKSVFSGETTLEQMKRSFEELIEWLFRENSFPSGVFLMTGTGIIPDNQFSLRHDDRVEITIEPIGTLANFVETQD